MGKDLLRLLDLSVSYEEGVNIIRANAELIDDELAEAILEKSGDFETGEKVNWFKGWRKEAEGAAFLNTFFDLAAKDSERANNLCLTKAVIGAGMTKQLNLLFCES